MYYFCVTIVIKIIVSLKLLIMKTSKRFVYYQPNKKDVADRFGDCTIRALSKVFEVDWLSAFMMTIPYCIEYQVPNIFNLPCKLEIEVMTKLGFVYYGISNRAGSKRPTIDEFAKSHPFGRYICNVSNHEVAVVDGKYYDTWDSGFKSLYGYYEKV